MKPLRLALRTPSGLVLDTPVDQIRAEDLDGWFGISPGRTDLIAILPPGLLVFTDAKGEAFVALAGGLLDLEDGRCRVMTQDATMSRDLESLSEQLEGLLETRSARGRIRKEALSDLIREALRRLIKEERA